MYNNGFKFLDHVKRMHSGKLQLMRKEFTAYEETTKLETAVLLVSPCYWIMESEIFRRPLSWIVDLI